jgi:putative ABC transport system permease protein
MATLREWVARLWGTIRRRRTDDDLAAELQAHTDLAAEAARRRGLSPDHASRAARLGTGGVAQALDDLRDQRGLPWLDTLARDSRYALRSLRRNPTFTAVALLTLALGIGANTAVFSVLDGVLLKPLPYPDAERLVAVWHTAPGSPGLATVSGDLRLSQSMYVTYAEQNRTLDAIGLWAPAAMTVTGMGDPEQVRGILVSDGTLQALNVAPVVGRWIGATDQTPGAPDTVMVGYGYWQRRFGGDRSVVGRSITVGSRPREIVGVMPRGFRIVTAEPDLIAVIPLVRSRLILAGFGFEAVARLKPGVTITEANADVARMLPIWMGAWPTITGGDKRVYETWRIAPALRPLKQDVVGSVGSALWLVMGTIAIVMLIACANVANLLLVRAESRQQELAVRAALGASAGRIVRALLLESVWLGVIGGALGVALAYAALRPLVSLAPAGLPRITEIAIDGRSLAFATLVSVMAGVVFGVIPAMKYRRPRIAETLHAGGRSSSDSRQRHRARGVLVVAQVSLALVLLIGSGLMIRTFQALRAVEPGFTHPEQLQTMRISIPVGLMRDAERVTRAQNAILEKLTAIPGVSAAAFATVMPAEGFAPDWDLINVEGQPIMRDGQTPPMRIFKSVSPGLFEAAGTRIVAGRDYTWEDLYSRRNVAIVSENLARELWGTAAAAIGKRVRTLETVAWREVVGVVQDVSENGLQQPAPAIVYWPALMPSLYEAGKTDASQTVTFVVRSGAAGTEGLLNQMRQAVWSVNPGLPMASVRTMQEIYDQSMARTSFTLVMLAIAGAMALVLGIVGIYGVISYAVSQRTREIGIRLALGARPRELEQMFVRHGLMLTAIGVVIGLGVAVGLSRLMSSLLYGVSALDPITFAAVPLVLATAAALASYLPARRVAAVDPVEALKAE